MEMYNSQAAGDDQMEGLMVICIVRSARAGWLGEEMSRSLNVYVPGDRFEKWASCS